ncbi:MAG: ATP-binding protein [Myxococcota bacterium]
MLVIALVMDVALVATGVATWVANRAAADDVASARALDLFRATRRSLRDWRDEHELGGPGGDLRSSVRTAMQATLSEVLEDLSDRGLRYVAIVDRRGVPLASAGEARGESGAVDEPEPGFGREPVPVRVGDRVRVDAPGGPPGFGRRGPRVVIEVDRSMADALSQSALQHLAVNLAAAAVLLVGALVFWRLGRKADRFEAQLARDRRLAALGEMSAVLGHELRNPLASLKGHAQLVVERLEPEARARKSAERVVLEATRLELLMRRVLDFVRTGAVELRPADPAAVLRAAADQVGQAGQAGGGARIALDTARAPASWSLDRQRMEQVLANLLENALQAAPEGSAVEATCALDGAELRFSVRDHGPGFPPDEGDLVFEPFRTHRIQGTGLGLAIARRIVEAHHGRIEALNAEGGGALVSVWLPADATPAAREA